LRQRQSTVASLRLPGAALAISVTLAVMSCATPASRNASSLAADTLAPLRQEDAVWLERVSFGLDSATVADYRRLGRERYLEAQLHGAGEELPPPIAAQIQEINAHQSAPEQRLRELLERRKAVNGMADGPERDQARKLLNDDAGQSAYRAIRLELLRAVYSSAQLREQMVSYCGRCTRPRSCVSRWCGSG
jgi:hypothetical protein